jgi:hypothetical protein
MIEKIIVLGLSWVLLVIMLMLRLRRTTTAHRKAQPPHYCFCPQCRLIYLKQRRHCPQGHRIALLHWTDAAHMAVDFELLCWTTDRHDAAATSELVQSIWGEAPGAEQIVIYRQSLQEF